MVIFVMLKGNSIAHEQKLIWKSSITEKYLWSFLKLVLRWTQHIKLVELIFWPLLFKIAHSLFRLILWFRLFWFLFLSYGIWIVFSLYLLIELFYFSNIKHIQPMDLLTFFFTCFERFDFRYHCQLSEYLRNIMQANRVTKIDKSEHMIINTDNIFKNFNSILFLFYNPSLCTS